MANEEKRPLKVFLCHASGDKPAVRALYQRLVRDGVDAWLDKEKLLPGQDWRLEIPKAVQESDVVVVCLSNKSITKEGYVQKEIKFALDSADEKPKGTIFLIPARLEECEVPSQLSLWQWVDLFESDGYERLTRSLRLRADKLGLGIGDTFYTDPEVEQKLDQLYTEGLAALWVEDWDRAQHRFQTILREKPDHIQAVAKLDEAKRQKHLSALYTQVLNAQENENWQAAVETLEKLTSEVADYKDVVLLLKNARRKKQLFDLYEEARRLHKARQWQAVVRVFAQIATLEPNYQDPAALLLSAEKEVAEIERLDKLNKLYSQGVHEMDAGHWYEARELLEQVHKAQTRFLETERLLKKVEFEIAKIEELKQRNIQINTLYEQAHGLIRSRNWHEALNKLTEIHKLDNQFEDKDGIAEKAKTALELEEQQIQKQNQLAAMYAGAVGLLKDGRYQEALDKWREVNAIDSKYPDRQWVQRTAQKKLAESGWQVKSTGSSRRLLWAGIIVFITLGALTTFPYLKAAFSSVLVVTHLPPPTEFYASTATPFPDEIVDDKGVPMALVPEGKFTMGSENGQVEEKPVHQVFLDAYYIDKYEVTNALYKACVNAGRCNAPKDASRYNDLNYAEHPVVYVNWNMANTYCEWRGARLPTEAEWEKSARGLNGRTYPWGEGINATYANYGFNVGDTTLVGSYESGKSPYGVYDMTGNVGEWVMDWYGETYYQSSPSSNPLGPDSGQLRVLRGGAWGHWGKLFQYAVDGLRSAYRTGLVPSSTNKYLGFRCSRPASQ